MERNLLERSLPPHDALRDAATGDLSLHKITEAKCSILFSLAFFSSLSALYFLYPLRKRKRGRKEKKAV